MNKRGRGRPQIVNDGIFIRPYIGNGQYENLKKESEERGVTMNLILREMLEERYNDSKRAD